MGKDNRFYITVPSVEKKMTRMPSSSNHKQYATTLLTGYIQGVFTCLQPVHVGTGLLVPPEKVGINSEAPLVKSFYQIDGRLTVPSSSIKGPVRSLIETITHSCVSTIGKKLRGKKFKGYQQCQHKSQWRYVNICVACQMFGTMGYQGHVIFGDAPLVTGETAVHHISPQHPPKRKPQHSSKRIRERHHYDHRLQDRRNPSWPMEVAIRDTRFSLHVRYHNLSKAQLGLLLLALGQGDPPICLKIGAGKNSGLGAVRFTDLQIKKLDIASLYTTYDSQALWQPVDSDACLTSARTHLREDNALARLQEALDCVHLRHIHD